MAKVQKKLKIELIECVFDYDRGFQELYYNVRGKEQYVALNTKNLIELLYQTNIIHTYEGEMVFFSTCYDYYDPTQYDGHGQDEVDHEIGIEEFMDEFFSDSDALDLIIHIEEKKRVKKIASYMADRIQRNLTKSFA